MNFTAGQYDRAMKAFASADWHICSQAGECPLADRCDHGRPHEVDVCPVCKLACDLGQGCGCECVRWLEPALCHDTGKRISLGLAAFEPSAPLLCIPVDDWIAKGNAIALQTGASA